MKAITKQQRRKLVALSAIVGTLIAVGVTAVAGGGLYYAFQSQTDPFTTSSSLDVRNLNAVFYDDDVNDANDRLKITATIKNSGQTSLTKVWIDEVTVSGVSIKQVDEQDQVQIGGVDANTTTEVKGIGASSILEGGRSQALVMDISDAKLNDVNISDRLSLTLEFKSGQDTLLTDVFTTRVKPG